MTADDLDIVTWDEAQAAIPGLPTIETFGNRIGFDAWGRLVVADLGWYWDGKVWDQLHILTPAEIQARFLYAAAPTILIKSTNNAHATTSMWSPVSVTCAQLRGDWRPKAKQQLIQYIERKQADYDRYYPGTEIYVHTAALHRFTGDSNMYKGIWRAAIVKPPQCSGGTSTSGFSYVDADTVL